MNRFHQTNKIVIFLPILSSDITYMDLFQALKCQVQTQSLRQKSKKINLFNRRKSTNLKHKRLNQLVNLNKLTPQKNTQSFLQTSINKYLTSSRKGSRMLTLTYKEEQDEINMKQKRREITNKIISNFHISGYKTNSHNYNQNNTKKTTKSLHHGSKNSILQLKQQNPYNNYLYVSNRSDKTLQVQTKKNSLPHLYKRSISFAEVSNTLSKHKKSRSPLGDYRSLQEDDIYFLKTGAISGQRLQNSRIKFTHQNRIPQQNDGQTLLVNSRSEPYKLAEQYYSLIRNTDYRKMTNYAGKKVIRSSLLQLNNKRNPSKQPFRISKLRGKSLIKLQEIIAKNQNKHLKL